jgi:hypothetical protein
VGQGVDAVAGRVRSKGRSEERPLLPMEKGDEGGPASPEGDVLSVGASRAALVLALGLQLIDVNPY